MFFILFPVDSLTTLLAENQALEPIRNSSIALGQLDAFDLVKLFVIYLLVHYLIRFAFFVSTNATSLRHRGNVTYSADGQASTPTREVIIESASTAAANRDTDGNNSAHSHHSHHHQQQSSLTNKNLSSISTTVSVSPPQSTPPVIEYFVSFVRSAPHSVRHGTSAPARLLASTTNNYSKHFDPRSFSTSTSSSKMVEIYKHQPNGGGGMPNNGNGQQDGYMEPEEEWEREGLLDPAWEKQQRKVSLCNFLSLLALVEPGCIQFGF